MLSSVSVDEIHNRFESLERYLGRYRMIGVIHVSAVPLCEL